MSSYYEKMLATGEVKCIDEEVPFEIPQGWEWCRLKHICSMQAGKNISASRIFSDKTELHPYRCVGGNGLRGYTGEFNTQGHYSIVGRQGALCGCINIEKGKFYATEHAVVVDTYEILSPLFMYYFLMALNLNKYATATAQPGLAVSNVLEVMCPLPPLNEGERIIKKLALLIPLVENYNAIQEKQNALNSSIKERLKKSILQEAIQGKLVPQIAEEGTAQELLEQIKGEKQKLVKDGKLKKSSLNDSVIFRGDDNKYYTINRNEKICIDDEIPFDIPGTWEWCRLGTLFSHCTGKALNASNLKGQLMTYITTSNLYWGRFELGNIKQMRFTDEEIEKCTATFGDLLVCEGGDIGRAAIWNYPYDIRIQNHIHKLRAYKQLCTKFFFWVFYFYKATGRIGGKGIGIQGLSSKALDYILIPLPPLKE